MTAFQRFLLALLLALIASLFLFALSQVRRILWIRRNAPTPTTAHVTQHALHDEGFSEFYLDLCKQASFSLYEAWRLYHLWQRLDALRETEEETTVEPDGLT